MSIVSSGVQRCAFEYFRLYHTSVPEQTEIASSPESFCIFVNITRAWILGETKPWSPLFWKQQWMSHLPFPGPAWHSITFTEGTKRTFLNLLIFAAAHAVAFCSVPCHNELGCALVNIFPALTLNAGFFFFLLCVFASWRGRKRSLI